MPYKIGASFKKMKTTESTQVKFLNLLRKSDNVLLLSKKVRVGKRAEEKNEDDVGSLKGDLEKTREALVKAQEAIGLAKKATTQVNTLRTFSRKRIHTLMTHTACRIPQRTFT